MFEAQRRILYLRPYLRSQSELATELGLRPSSLVPQLIMRFHLDVLLKRLAALTHSDHCGLTSFFHLSLFFLLCARVLIGEIRKNV